MAKRVAKSKPKVKGKKKVTKLDGPQHKEFPPQKHPPEDPNLPWRDEEMVLHMPKVDQFQAVMYREKMAKLDALAATKRLTADKLEWQAQQKVMGLRLEAKRIAEEVDEARAEYEALLIRIGRKFGLDEKGEYRVNFLHTHGFDSETGKVVLIDPQILKKEV